MAPKAPPPKGAKQIKVSQTDVPSHSLKDAISIAGALYDHFAAKDAAPHDIALALDTSPTSSAWRSLTGAAVAYGLTNGGYNANSISLTDLGRRIVAPTEEGDDDNAKVEAMLKPRILREFFEKYDRAKFPREDIAKNVLATIGVPNDRLDRVFSIVRDNGQFTGAIRNTKTGPFVALTGATPPSTDILEDEDDGVATEPALVEVRHGGSEGAPAPAIANEPKQIFVAHGKNHKPLNDLKKILDQFKIPYKVAVDEPNVGRPISKKVAQLMRECSAGIFIFTGDEKFTDTEGSEIFRPSENVVYELGAASVLWENKIIILKQKDVTFPSDFKDLGYIEFDVDQLAVHALDLLKELIGFEFIRVQAA